MAFPPRVEFLYGEWRRDDYEGGLVPGPEPMADLGPEIALTLASNRALAGPPRPRCSTRSPMRTCAEPSPRACRASSADLETDTRNVVLTLARIWATLATGEISSKDEAAAWALERVLTRSRDR